MNMIWVLVVISFVNGGQSVSFQEFTSKTKCDSVLEYVESVRAKQTYNRLLDARCVEK